MKKNIVITILSVLVIGLCAYLVYDKIINKDVKEKNIEENSKVDTELDTKNIEEETKFENYDLNSVSKIILNNYISTSDGEPPQESNVVIKNKDEIKYILSQIDDATLIEELPDGIGFQFLFNIEIRYNDNSYTRIFFLNNNNLAINNSISDNEMEYKQYSISNTNLKQELINLYY